MSAATEVEFLRAEAEFWRSEYERVATTLANLEKAAQASRWAEAAPPEPPVGTRFVMGDVVRWEHREDGWFCTRVICYHCPTPWDEVLGQLVPGAVRVFPAADVDDAGIDFPGLEEACYGAPDAGPAQDGAEPGSAVTS